MSLIDYFYETNARTKYLQWLSNRIIYWALNNTRTFGRQKKKQNENSYFATKSSLSKCHLYCVNFARAKCRLLRLRVACMHRAKQSSIQSNSETASVRSSPGLAFWMRWSSACCACNENCAPTICSADSNKPSQVPSIEPFSFAIRRKSAPIPIDCILVNWKALSK